MNPTLAFALAPAAPPDSVVHDIAKECAIHPLPVVDALSPEIKREYDRCIRALIDIERIVYPFPESQS